MVGLVVKEKVLLIRKKKGHLLTLIISKSYNFVKDLASFYAVKKVQIHLRQMTSWNKKG